MHSDHLKLNSYKISVDDTLLDNLNHITPEVRKILEEVRPDMEKGRKYLIKKLNKLCRKYPKTPIFKNFLSTVYQKNGNNKQAYAVNQWLVKEHPDYLIGKINLALELLLNDETEKIPEILGHTMEISELYPERKEFHLEEVVGFYGICVQYLLKIDEIEHAEMRMKVLKEVDQQHPRTQYAEELLQNWYSSRASVRLEKERQRIKRVKVKDTRAHLQTTSKPDFHFPELIGRLYENDLNITPEEIGSILQLDPAKLNEDLEKVLQDSMTRFDFFVGQVQKEGYDPKKLSFPIHALLFLATLKNQNSLVPLLQLLHQDRDFMQFWFGDMDHVIENVLYHCGQHNIRLLLEFLKLPNVSSMGKAIAGEALVKIIHETNEERKLLIEEYREILNLHIEKVSDENFADTESTSFLICDIMDLGYKELLPEIQRLFDLNMVETDIPGPFDEVENEIMQSSFGINMSFNKKDIYVKYDEFRDSEETSTTSLLDEDSFAEMYHEEIVKRAIRDGNLDEPTGSSKKIGRNDPCPCRSGKKYKKCCMNG